MPVAFLVQKLPQACMVAAKKASSYSSHDNHEIEIFCRLMKQKSFVNEIKNFKARWRYFLLLII